MGSVAIKRHITGQCVSNWLKTSIAALSDFHFFFQILVPLPNTPAPPSFVCCFYIWMCMFSLFHHILRVLATMKPSLLRDNAAETFLLWSLSMLLMLHCRVCDVAYVGRQLWFEEEEVLVVWPLACQATLTQYWNSGSQTGRGRRHNGPEWSGRGCLARVI